MGRSLHCLVREIGVSWIRSLKTSARVVTGLKRMKVNEKAVYGQRISLSN